MKHESKIRSLHIRTFRLKRSQPICSVFLKSDSPGVIQNTEAKSTTPPNYETQKRFHYFFYVDCTLYPRSSTFWLEYCLPLPSTPPKSNYGLVMEQTYHCATPPKKLKLWFGHGAIYSKMPTFVYELIWHLETQSQLNCLFYVVFLRSDFVGFILKTEWLNTEWGRKDFYFLRFLKSRQLMSLAFLTGVIQNSVELNTEWVKDWFSISFHMNFF